MRCQHCERPGRPHKASLADYPGTVAIYYRGLCGTCYGKYRHQYPAPEPTDWEYLLAELDWIRGDGLPEDRARRIGKSAATIVYAARRHGRTDIADEFASAAYEQTQGAA